MNNTVRKIERVRPDGALTLQLPEFGGDDVEIIVWRHSESIPSEAVAVMQLQEQSGFARQVLSDPAEDIWNDL